MSQTTIFALPIGLIQDRSDEVREVSPDEPGFGMLLPNVEDGCAAHASCFTCPFPDCIRDKQSEQRLRRKGQKALLNQQIVAAHNQGVGIRDLVVRFGVRERTIYRVIARAKKAS